MIIRHGVATKLVLYLFRNSNNKMNYESRLRREIDCTYLSLLFWARELKQRGFVEVISVSNRKYLSLTTKGEKVAQNLDNLKRLI